MKTCWPRIPKRLKALSQLRTISQWWLFGRILIVAVLVPVLFRFNLSIISRLLDPGSSPPLGAKDSAAIECIIRCVELVMATCSPLVRRNCLTRCITMYYFLRPAGLELSICFGATLKNGRLEPVPGHCWLVKDGKPFLERNDPSGRFVPIYTLPVLSHNSP